MSPRESVARALWLALAAGACVERVDAGADVVAPRPPATRGDVAPVDPPPTLPEPAARAQAGGVVVLRAPASNEAVGALLAAFFEAWRHESLDGLVALLAPDAGPLDARARGSRALLEEWRQRMRAHSYPRLAAAQMFRLEAVARWGPDEPAPAGVPWRVDVRSGELGVSFPVEVPQVGGERFFGDVIVMVLRPEQGKLRIVGYAETERR